MSYPETGSRIDLRDWGRWMNEFKLPSSYKLDAVKSAIDLSNKGDGITTLNG